MATCTITATGTFQSTSLGPSNSNEITHDLGDNSALTHDLGDNSTITTDT